MENTMHARQQQNLRKAKIIASKMEKRDNPEAKNSLRYLWEKKAVIDMTVVFSILSIFTVVCIFVIF